MSANPHDHSAKRLARLAAVQGLYQIALATASADEVIRHFAENPAAFLEEAGGKDAAVDNDLFIEIVRGVTADTDALDAMIADACAEGVSAARLEILLRAILRAGAYELHQHGPIPAGVIINDYVDVAHAFFGGKEPGLINAILDGLAKKLRG